MRSTCSCVIRLAIVSIASLYLPTASVTTGEVKEASSDPGVQHGVVGFREAGVDWSLRNGVEVTRRLMAPTAASLAGHHSTGTALLRMRNDILVSMNKQQVTLLVFLDLSVAFDTVDHDILLRRLEYKFGIKDQAVTCLNPICRIDPSVL